MKRINTLKLALGILLAEKCSAAQWPDNRRYPELDELALCKISHNQRANFKLTPDRKVKVLVQTDIYAMRDIDLALLPDGQTLSDDWDTNLNVYVCVLSTDETLQVKLSELEPCPSDSSSDSDEQSKPECGETTAHEAEESPDSDLKAKYPVGSHVVYPREVTDKTYDLYSFFQKYVVVDATLCDDAEWSYRLEPHDFYAKVKDFDRKIERHQDVKEADLNKFMNAEFADELNNESRYRKIGTKTFVNVFYEGKSYIRFHEKEAYYPSKRLYNKRHPWQTIRKSITYKKWIDLGKSPEIKEFWAPRVKFQEEERIRSKNPSNLRRRLARLSGL